MNAAIEGGGLARGAELIIVDDPTRRQEIDSKFARDKVKNNYAHSISVRLNHSMVNAFICVVGGNGLEPLTLSV
jgi:hypothetical protein